MFDRSRKALRVLAIFLCFIMSDYVSYDNDFSLSVLTQEDPKYVSVVYETSDEEESSNYKVLLEHAKQLGGDDVRKNAVGSCNDLTFTDSISVAM